MCVVCVVFRLFLLGGYFCVFLQIEKRYPLYRRQLLLREESPGSTESPYFLTGRGAPRKWRATASATENIPPSGKGENAR